MRWNLTVFNPANGDSRTAQDIASKDDLVYTINNLLRELETGRTISKGQLDRVLSTTARSDYARAWDGYFEFVKILDSHRYTGTRVIIKDGKEERITPQTVRRRVGRPVQVIEPTEPTEPAEATPNDQLIAV